MPNLDSVVDFRCCLVSGVRCQVSAQNSNTKVKVIDEIKFDGFQVLRKLYGSIVRRAT